MQLFIGHMFLVSLRTYTHLNRRQSNTRRKRRTQSSTHFLNFNLPSMLSTDVEGTDTGRLNSSELVGWNQSSEKP